MGSVNVPSIFMNLKYKMFGDHQNLMIKFFCLEVNARELIIEISSNQVPLQNKHQLTELINLVLIMSRFQVSLLLCENLFWTILGAL